METPRSCCSKYGTWQIEYSEACFPAHKGPLHVSTLMGFLIYLGGALIHYLSVLRFMIKSRASYGRICLNIKLLGNRPFSQVGNLGIETRLRTQKTQDGGVSLLRSAMCQ